MLYDNHGRPINYLRLAVTDRCNLRCHYCMPEEGINYLPRKELLTFEEMIRLIQIFSKMGISKLRITGGEPFLRKNMRSFLEQLSFIKDLKQIHITTNGTLTRPHIPILKKMGIASINLSLDTLRKNQFYKITRRDQYEEVWATFLELIDAEIPTKINAVILPNENTEDILPMVELTKKYPVSVRFIEEMPFNGDADHQPQLTWDYKKILDHISTTYPDIQKIPDPPFSTSFNYKIPGHQGTVGIIAAYSRLFCGTCNRIRLTPQGMLKTCLYDDGVFNIRDLMRNGVTDQQISTTLLQALGSRWKDGFEAEKNRNIIQESMATIGG